MKETLIATAREPSQAPIFNHASMAHNNHFFFKNLNPSSSPPSMPDALARDLAASFSSVESLRREMVLTASAMFGPGFVWLVKAAASDYRVLATYLAGSPYAAAHWRRQDADLNTAANSGAADGGGAGSAWLQNQARGAAGGFAGAGGFGGGLGAGAGFGALARKEVAPGAADVVPLLCVNTWEHVWLRDYGVAGKRAFLEAWWEKVDWEQVANAANIARPTLQFR